MMACSSQLSIIDVKISERRITSRRLLLPLIAQMIETGNQRFFKHDLKGDVITTSLLRTTTTLNGYDDWKSKKNTECPEQLTPANKSNISKK